MIVEKLIIKNYKLFRHVSINMNPDMNIFVGENDSGKSTILEALSIVLTGRLNSGTIMSRLNLDWFNDMERNKYRSDIQNNTNSSLPSIKIEAYLKCISNDDFVLNRYKGTNNSLREDTIGIVVEIMFDDQYASTYTEQLKAGKIDDIPIEYYKVCFRTFGSSDNYLSITAKRVAYIDTTKKDYGSVLNRFISSSISSYLSDYELTQLRHAYRANRSEFTLNSAVESLNSKLREEFGFLDRTVSINLRESEIDAWKNEMSLSLNGTPLDNYGFGTQNMFKSEMYIRQNDEVDALIFEEPENNLSYTNMSILISKLAETSNKQMFISTHSSYVANKLGLQHLHLVAGNTTKSFKELSKSTYEYFLKLPGYNTLRLLLANKIILVEGPADELIVQRAYLDKYSKLPINNGIDVMAVGGIAFLRYCELAKLISKKVTIVIDNDGNHKKVKDKYRIYSDVVNLCVEEDDSINTLEPSVLKANMKNFEEFKFIIYCGNDILRKSRSELEAFMKANKTEWSMRVFLSETRISYPLYIEQAIKTE